MMRKYKVNNSNTVYVYSEAIKDWEKVTKETEKNQKTSVRTISRPGPNPHAYLLNLCVKSPTYGEGIVVESKENGVFTVAYENKHVKYVASEAFGPRKLTLL